MAIGAADHRPKTTAQFLNSCDSGSFSSALWLPACITGCSTMSINYYGPAVPAVTVGIRFGCLSKHFTRDKRCFRLQCTTTQVDQKYCNIIIVIIYLRDFGKIMSATGRRRYRKLVNGLPC